MYSINLSNGVVTRDSDNTVVSPVDSVLDPLFLEYNAWCNAGNDPTVLTESLDEIKQNQIALINAECQKSLSIIVDGYPSLEIATWDTQSSEAKALLLDPNAPAPMLAQIATGNNVPVLVLAQLVASKSLTYKNASGYIVGRRQVLANQINTCTTIDAVRLIVW